MPELIALRKTVQAINPDRMKNPEDYVMEDNDLRAAVNAALVLGKPLLLTGEAGVGKSQFASWLAYELRQETPVEMFKFVVKSTSEARDLFYHYDALARFHEAQIHGMAPALRTMGDVLDGSSIAGTATQALAPAMDPHRYIRYNALGMAILFSMGRQAALDRKLIAADMKGLEQPLPDAACRSVVLIDEIDKAPRDVPNDILDEIDNLSFRVRELGDLIAEADKSARPIIVITSNSERDLPKPFLRRCIYYHMQFPSKEKLSGIVERRVGARFSANSGLLGECITLFWFLRDEASLRRPPGLAELLDLLHGLGATGEGMEVNALLEVGHIQAKVMATLVKDPDDQAALRQGWPSWVKQALA